MSEKDFAAQRRADYLRALKEERDSYERVGAKDRAKAVEAEIKRAEGVKGRKAPEADES